MPDSGLRPPADPAEYGEYSSGRAVRARSLSGYFWTDCEGALVNGVFVSVDGEVSPADRTFVPVLDRGFLYGDSAFEVLRTYERRPFALERHLERLERSCVRLLIDLPVGLDVIESEMFAALDHAGYTDSYVRILVTRGVGPLTYDPLGATSPRRVIIVGPVPVFPESIYTEGVSVSCKRVTRPTDDARAAGAKASNYLAPLLAAHEARQEGGFEALVLGPHGEVWEGATSNVFVVRAGGVFTTPTTAPILGGVTRSIVLEEAREKGLRIAEEVLFPSDLYGADEVFITSSLREVVPVVRVDGVVIAGGRPGRVAKETHAAYRRRAGVAPIERH